MHETGLCEAVVDAIRRRARGRRVEWARVRVGGHAVDPRVVCQGVAMAAAGTEAEGLDLDVVLEPMVTRCRACGAEEPVRDALTLVACPLCGGVDIEVEGLEHSVLEAVRYRPDGQQARGREEGSWTLSSS